MMSSVPSDAFGAGEIRPSVRPDCFFLEKGVRTDTSPGDIRKPRRCVDISGGTEIAGLATPDREAYFELAEGITGPVCQSEIRRLSQIVSGRTTFHRKYGPAGHDFTLTHFSMTICSEHFYSDPDIFFLKKSVRPDTFFGGFGARETNAAQRRLQKQLFSIWVLCITLRYCTNKILEVIPGFVGTLGDTILKQFWTSATDSFRRARENLSNCSSDIFP